MADRIGLFDADIFAYKWAAAAEQRFDWGDGTGPVWAVSEDQDEARKKLIGDIEDIASKLRLARIIVCLSDAGRVYFRHAILPSYKQNRRRGHKPAHLDFLKASLHKYFEVDQRPGLEADDCMGILATWPGMKGRKVIISSDKDMGQIPGWWFDPTKHREPVRVLEETGDRLHLFQTLTGDAVDGYSGVPGVGPKKANAILGYIHEHPSAQWRRVVQAYKAAGLTEDDALVQARVARICRASDYDFEERKAIPWAPPSKA